MAANVTRSISNIPKEVAAKAKDEMREQGYDPDNPRLDRKFISWMRNNFW
jgi:hypothetical protein